MNPKISLVSRVFPVLVVGAVVATVGCVSMEGTAHTRAVNDLRCGEDQVVVKNIGGSSYRATGCGQEATYNCGQSTGSTFVCQREEQRAVTTTSAH
jgi:hypothetical protein